MIDDNAGRPFVPIIASEWTESERNEAAALMEAAMPILENFVQSTKSFRAKMAAEESQRARQEPTEGETATNKAVSKATRLWHEAFQKEILKTLDGMDSSEFLLESAETQEHVKSALKKWQAANRDLGKEIEALTKKLIGQ